MSSAKQESVPFSIWLMWSVAVLFGFYQLFLQLSSGLIIKDLMRSFSIQSFQAGLLSAAYYYVYVLLQTPAGLLLDRYGARRLITYGNLICALFCFVFAWTDSFALAIVARVIMGLACTFAFVGAVYILREWFPVQRFGFLFGMMEGLGMIVTVVATLFLSKILTLFGWRESFMVVALFGFGLFIACACLIRDKPSRTNSLLATHIPFWTGFRRVLSDRGLWLNGLYSGILFSLVTVFAALWAIPFLQLSAKFAITEAALACAWLYVGVAIGGPLLTLALPRYRHLFITMVACPIITALLFLWLLYLPGTTKLVIYSLMFAIGFFSSTYILNFPIANQIASEDTKNTAIGFTNTLCVATAPVLQPLIGLFIDAAENPHALQSHQHALWILPVLLVVAAGIAVFIPYQRDESSSES